MHSLQNDRRKNNQRASFPLQDGEGQIVQAERRSGKDRRRTPRQNDIVSKILGILH